MTEEKWFGYSARGLFRHSLGAVNEPTWKRSEVVRK